LTSWRFFCGWAWVGWSLACGRGEGGGREEEEVWRVVWREVREERWTDTSQRFSQIVIVITFLSML
jgi:hypothetical protein